MCVEVGQSTLNGDGELRTARAVDRNEERPEVCILLLQSVGQLLLPLP